ncbi:MAG TPA: methyltransferase domain-containing protein, partial [Candidatus Eremiobacteraeota bacterium]|nr:methyltransferase domain-containing protein [Candidatus Eremiobacteraeota bacterium]
EDEIEDRFKGFFNIITCNNVLEHVKNPERTIRNISSLLSPEGIAYFEIPNKYFPGFILKDEHTSLFAITLLEQSDALTYYNRFHPDGIYTVGHYLTLDEYINSFKKAAMDPSVVDEIFSDYRKDKILKDIGELKNNKYTLLSSVPEDIRGLLQQKLNLYLKGFFKTLKYDEKNFPLSYGVPYWKIVCKKTSL